GVGRRVRPRTATRRRTAPRGSTAERKELTMAWDFSTEPEFEAKLDWMRGYVREEIIPLEPIAEQIDNAALERAWASLQPAVKERGLWAAHLPPELGGQGFGQVKLGLMN